MATLLSNAVRQNLLTELQKVFDAPVSEVLLRAMEQTAIAHEESVLHADVVELRQAVTSLAVAQARSEERLTRVEVALEKLAVAQARSEERLTRVEVAVEKLAAAQARTEQRVEELAAAQARSEERLTRVEAAVEKLATAQARTEQTVNKLAEAVDWLGKQVGGLSETVGGDIEDIAYIVLHRVLKREYGWQVGVLKRAWQKWDGKPEEVNVFGQATDPARPDQTIWIVGEAKHNLTVKEVDRFTKQLERARRNLAGEIWPVCFCYRARPEVQERLKAENIRLVFSYGELA